MRSKEEIQLEIADYEKTLVETRQRVELNRQLISEYEDKIEVLQWVLEEEEPVKTEGTR